jgi:hypothetical protein
MVLFGARRNVRNIVRTIVGRNFEFRTTELLKLRRRRKKKKREERWNEGRTRKGAEQQQASTLTV